MKVKQAFVTFTLPGLLIAVAGDWKYMASAYLVVKNSSEILNFNFLQF